MLGFLFYLALLHHLVYVTTRLLLPRCSCCNIATSYDYPIPNNGCGFGTRSKRKVVCVSLHLPIRFDRTVIRYNGPGQVHTATESHQPLVRRARTTNKVICIICNGPCIHLNTQYNLCGRCTRIHNRVIQLMLFVLAYSDSCIYVFDSEIIVQYSTTKYDIRFIVK